MELLQLHYFFDSSRTECFAHTAEKYRVPTSAVSASIKRLEQELGCKLFDRTSNRITLNENGRRLQRSLGAVLSELEQAISDITTNKEEDICLRILVRSLRGSINRAVIRYRRLFPTVRFQTVFDFYETDYRSYDLVIDEQTDAYPEMERFELCRLRVRIRTTADSPLLGHPLTMDQLRNQPFVTMGEKSNMHRLLIKSCRKAGFTPNIVLETNDASCYNTAIREGVGIGPGREYPSRDNTQQHYLNITDFDEHQTFFCYYHRQTASPALQQFVDFLRDFIP